MNVQNRNTIILVILVVLVLIVIGSAGILFVRSPAQVGQLPSLVTQPSSTLIYTALVVQSSLTPLVSMTPSASLLPSTSTLSVEFVSPIAWSPDSREIAVASNFGTNGQIQNAAFEVQDAATGKVLHSLDVQQNTRGRYVIGISWNRTTKQIAVNYYPFAVGIIDPNTYQETYLPQPGNGYYGGLSWNPQGDRLAIPFFLAQTGVATTLQILDTSTRQSIAQFDLNKSIINTSAWSPDGDRVAASDGDGIIRIWSISQNKQLLQFSYHDPDAKPPMANFAASIAWSPDGKYIAAADAGGSDKGNGMVYLWDPTTGKSLSAFTADSSFAGNHIDISWRPDSKLFAVASPNGILIFSADTGKTAYFIRTSSDVTALAWSPDGSKIAYAQLNDPVVHVIPAPNGTEPTFAPTDVPRLKLVFLCSPDHTNGFEWAILNPNPNA